MWHESWVRQVSQRAQKTVICERVLAIVWDHVRYLYETRNILRLSVTMLLQLAVMMRWKISSMTYFDILNIDDIRIFIGIDYQITHNSPS